MFTKVVTVFLLYPMVLYFGKLEAKFYVHIVYWILMVPVIVLQAVQIKDGNTINRTRIICTGLLLRILLSNFDLEGKQLGFDYYVRIIGLTINFVTASFLTLFANMFNSRLITSITSSVIVATLSSFAWQGGSYDDKSFVKKEYETTSNDFMYKKDHTKLIIWTIVAQSVGILCLQKIFNIFTDEILKAWTEANII